METTFLKSAAGGAGRRKKWKNQYIDLVEEKPQYIVAGAREGLTNNQAAFLRERAAGCAEVYCELGCGSGEHLAELAIRRPGALHIGFELRFKRAFSAAKKAEAAGLTNLLVVRSNAVILPSIFPPGSIRGIYINFPDPWERQKWRKHRLLTPELIDGIANVLSLGGLLSYKTDHRENFEETKNLLRANRSFRVTRETDNLHSSPYSISNVKSEFEKLFISKGLQIHFLEAERVSS